MTRNCIFKASETGRDVVCENQIDMTHPGTVPKEMCDACPFFRAKTYENQCARLWVKKTEAGEYRPRPKPCGGCGTTKHRIGHDLQFVWPYWEGAAEGDELRWSIRSVETMFEGQAKITIIGDTPDWYTGHVIRKKRVPASKLHQCFRDMLSKVWYMATHAEIDSQCVWMMDDIYFVRSFTLEDVATPRAEPFRESDINKWQKIKANTMAALTAKGRPNHDYATHAPHLAEKEKLRALFDEFNLHDERNVLTWEILYGNTYRENPVRCHPWFVRFNEPSTLQVIRQRLARATCFNHAAGCWNADMRQFLSEILTEPSSAETGETPGFYLRSKLQRIVKRRPLHTHKAYIEKQRAKEAVE
jgi:hypothetical protein